MDVLDAVLVDPARPPLVNVASARSALKADADAVRAVEALGMPRGLAEQCVKSTKEFAYRFWIIDNSGSMGTADGKHLVSGGGLEAMVSCSRWEELGASIGWHAKLAVELGAWTERGAASPFPRRAPPRTMFPRGAPLRTRGFLDARRC